MEILICKREGCNNQVAESKRSDSFYCRPWCGTTQRNKDKREANQEKRPHSRKVDTNYKIVRDLYSNGDDDVSIESLELLGFDFNYCTGVDDLDIQTGIMKFKIYEFLLTPLNNRYKISKPAS